MWNENIEKLKAVALEQCNTRMNATGTVNTSEIAAWLTRKNRPLVIDALADLVCQTMEQWNDDDRAARELKRRPDLRQLDESIRQVSRVLGVGRWYLLTLDGGELAQAYEATQLIHKLRAAEANATLEAMKRAEEFLRPVTDGHPDMTVADALIEIERQTDDTIRGLEAEGGDA